MAQDVHSTSILILGTTGHGKSRLANSLLRLSPNDQTTFNFRIENTVTGETMESEIFSAIIDECKLTVIDTPGLFDNGVNMDERWVDVLKAFCLEERGIIDAIIVAVHSRHLYSAARSFRSILDYFDGLNITRVIVVFTHLDHTRKEECELCLAQFNNHLKRGTVGVKYFFSDQEADAEVVERTMDDIIKHVKDIQNKSVAPINKDVFVKYTKHVLQNVLQRCPQITVTLGDLRNSPSINMSVIEEFIENTDIERMIEQRNESKNICTVM